MEKLLINFSNHKSSMWSDKQKEGYEILDVPFPMVSPTANTEEIEDLAKAYTDKIMEFNPNTVMVQGKMTLTYKVVSMLKAKGIKCVAGCSDRKVKEIVLPDGTTKKESVFEFIQFREY